MADTYIAVARTPRAIIRHFTSHAADAPERAMGFNPTQDSEAELFDRLQAQGLIRQASPTLFYVDRAGLTAQQERSLARVLSAGAVVGTLITGISALRARRRRRS